MVTHVLVPAGQVNHSGMYPTNLDTSHTRGGGYFCSLFTDIGPAFALIKGIVASVSLVYFGKNLAVVPKMSTSYAGKLWSPVFSEIFPREENNVLCLTRFWRKIAREMSITR